MPEKRVAGAESRKRKRGRWLSAFLLLVPVALFLLNGCQLGYYSQAVKGQVSLMAKRQPVEKVMADPATPEAVRQQLLLAEQVREYAAAEMDLPAEKVYRSYVALESEAVVWNVLAAPRLSLTPRTWCYPLLGCLSYRGYFDKQAAWDEARRLAAEGEDTYVGGAIAYSTLGWFADPLTTPMIETSGPGLVELLLHELTHRKLYLRGDTGFNESLATMVAREGTLRYLAHHSLSLDWQRWRQRDAARAAFLELVADARQALARLYASDRDDEDKLRAKAAVIDTLREDYRQRVTRIPALADYSGFFAGPLNNAQLNGVRDYYGLVPAFQRLLLDCGGEWACFWPRVEALAKDDDARRQWAGAKGAEF